MKAVTRRSTGYHRSPQKKAYFVMAVQCSPGAGTLAGLISALSTREETLHFRLEQANKPRVHELVLVRDVEADDAGLAEMPLKF